MTRRLPSASRTAWPTRNSDTPPDRLSLDPRSEHYDEALLSRGVGIKFNGQEKTNVIEYSVSEGWIRVAAGRSRDRYGQPMTLKLKGKVEPYFEGVAQAEATPTRSKVQAARSFHQEFRWSPAPEAVERLGDRLAEDTLHFVGQQHCLRKPELERPRRCAAR